MARWGTSDGFFDELFPLFPVLHNPLGVGESHRCSLFACVFVYVPVCVRACVRAPTERESTSQRNAKE